MTALALKRQRDEELRMSDLTAKNITKVTRYRKNGEEELDQLVNEFSATGLGNAHEGAEVAEKRKVYPDHEKGGFTPKNQWRYSRSKEEKAKRAEMGDRWKERKKSQRKGEGVEEEEGEHEPEKSWHGGMWRR